MQTAEEVGKFVTDGIHIYPYNQFLDGMIETGKLQYCTAPDPDKKGQRPQAAFKSVQRLTSEERKALAGKIGVTLGDVNNLSDQEYTDIEKNLANGRVYEHGELVEAPPPARELVSAPNGFPA